MKGSRYNIVVERPDGAFVYNGVSGGLLRVAPDEQADIQRLLSGDDDVICRPSTLTDLAQGHMLIADEQDELALLEQRYATTRHQTSRLSLTLVASLGCNFDCPYCFEAKHPSIMDADVESALLSYVDDRLPGLSVLHVSWFGGEPLVGKRPLLSLSRTLIDRCDRTSVDYSATITTNGYLLDDATCRQLRDARVKDVQLSLDGPPETHDRMRPLANGRGTFWKILENTEVASGFFNVSIRINVDKSNVGSTEQLLQILREAGLAGRVRVYLGHLVGIDGGASAPSTTYGSSCLSSPEFAEQELTFNAIASRYGFAPMPLPRPKGAPCTAVREHDLVVGSEGELYKCYESVGDPREVIGNIRDYEETNGRLQKWLKYDPFSDAECRSCIALPVCMGGCANHALSPSTAENRCDTFRFTYEERVRQVLSTSIDGHPTAMLPTPVPTSPSVGRRKLIPLTDVSRD